MISYHAGILGLWNDLEFAYVMSDLCIFHSVKQELATPSNAQWCGHECRVAWPRCTGQNAFVLTQCARHCSCYYTLRRHVAIKALLRYLYCRGQATFALAQCPQCGYGEVLIIYICISIVPIVAGGTKCSGEADTDRIISP